MVAIEKFYWKVIRISIVLLKEITQKFISLDLEASRRTSKVRTKLKEYFISKLKTKVHWSNRLFFTLHSHYFACRQWPGWLDSTFTMHISYVWQVEQCHANTWSRNHNFRSLCINFVGIGYRKAGNPKSGCWLKGINSASKSIRNKHSVNLQLLDYHLRCWNGRTEETANETG